MLHNHEINYWIKHWKMGISLFVSTGQFVLGFLC